MTLLIDLIDETGQVTKEQLEEVEKLLQFAADALEVKDQAEVSVTIVSNEEIHQINKEYRGKDAPTDVISFALEEEGEGKLKSLVLMIFRLYSVTSSLVWTVQKSRQRNTDILL